MKPMTRGQPGGLRRCQRWVCILMLTHMHKAPPHTLLCPALDSPMPMLVAPPLQGSRPILPSEKRIFWLFLFLNVIAWLVLGILSIVSFSWGKRFLALHAHAHGHYRGPADPAPPPFPPPGRRLPHHPHHRDHPGDLQSHWLLQVQQRGQGPAQELLGRPGPECHDAVLKQRHSASIALPLTRSLAWYLRWASKLQKHFAVPYRCIGAWYTAQLFRGVLGMATVSEQWMS